MDLGTSEDAQFIDLGQASYALIEAISSQDPSSLGQTPYASWLLERPAGVATDTVDL